MSRVLVTGGAGFIGQHLVRALLGSGREVVIIDDYSTGQGETLPETPGSGLTVVRGDFCNDQLARSALAGCESLFHLAAMVSVPQSVADPARCRAINIEGSRRLFANASGMGVRRIIFASSCAIYGPGIEGPIPESCIPNPLSPYAESKLAGERLLLEAATDAPSAVVLRFFNVYGPGQRADSAYAAAIPKFIDAARTGTPPVVYGDGLQSRDFIYVEDLVRALLLAERAPDAHAGRAYNLASGKAVTLNEVLARLRDLPGSKLAPAIYQPERAGDIRHSLADIRAAREGLNFLAKTSFAEGLAQLWAAASG